MNHPDAAVVVCDVSAVERPTPAVPRPPRFVIPSDDVRPAALADLGADCPLGLWVRGHEQLPQLTARAMAVTGNRAAAEALTRAKAFATAVAEAGHTVTATLAYGVDSAAHRAAARAGRATLAGLPRGLDRAHPHDHAQLLSSTPTSGGAVVSLFPPGTPARWRHWTGPGRGYRRRRRCSPTYDAIPALHLLGEDA
ncbi:DNA-processing protein DprA [Streptomyces sp. NRRL S-813]|uniref:DNA-processing protein DprA n=1 Tax=Streptomyces sp. NRRL S-813 TaxID=1463919 RepID=UPI0004C1265D|nr:DNA-processing protein DprA [Streptomyces sp. NRRL S-813]